MDPQFCVRILQTPVQETVHAQYQFQAWRPRISEAVVIMDWSQSSRSKTCTVQYQLLKGCQEGGINTPNVSLILLKKLGINGSRHHF